MRWAIPIVGFGVFTAVLTTYPRGPFMFRALRPLLVLPPNGGSRLQWPSRAQFLAESASARVVKLPVG